MFYLYIDSSDNSILFKRNRDILEAFLAWNSRPMEQN